MAPKAAQPVAAQPAAAQPAEPNSAPAVLKPRTPAREITELFVMPGEVRGSALLNRLIAPQPQKQPN